MLFFTLTACGGMNDSSSKGGDVATNPGTNDKESWRHKVGPYPFDLVVVDLDGDALKDLVIMSHGEELLVYKNGGQRKFELKQSVKSVGHHPNGVRVIDVDGDGKPDQALTSNEGRSSYQRYTIDPDGSFSLADEHRVGVAVYSMEVGDLDKDGRIDAVMGTGPGGETDRIVVVWDALSPNPKIKVIQTNYWRTLFPKIGDVNNDGALDIVVMGADKSRLAVLINRGSRKFKQSTIKTPEGVSREVDLVDLNWDGNLDYLLPFGVGKRALIIYNDGKGLMGSSEVIDAPVFGFRYGNAYADEEKALLALGEEGRVFFALKKRGQDSWTIKEFPAGSVPWRFRFVDLDNDGQLDVIFLNSASGELQVVWDVMRLFEK